MCPELVKIGWVATPWVEFWRVKLLLPLFHWKWVGLGRFSPTHRGDAEIE